MSFFDFKQPCIKYLEKKKELKNKYRINHMFNKYGKC